jgi:hypothetical protein
MGRRQATAGPKAGIDDAQMAAGKRPFTARRGIRILELAVGRPRLEAFPPATP